MATATETLERVAAEVDHGRAGRMLLAGLYSVQRQYDKAAGHVKGLLGHYPDDGELLALAARLSGQLGDFAAAAKYSVRGYATDPNDPVLLSRALHGLRQADQTEAALALLLEATERPELATAAVARRLQLAALPLFVQTRRYEDAAELLGQWYLIILTESAAAEKSAAIATANQVAAGNLIWALTEAGYYERAMLHSRAMLLRYDRGGENSAVRVVRHLNIRRRHGRSEDFLKELLHYRPNSITLRAELYGTMAGAEQMEAALTGAEQWYANDPNDRNRQRLLISLFAEAGQYDRAIELLGAEQPNETDNGRRQLEMAALLVKAGRMAVGAALLEQEAPSEELAGEWLDMRIQLYVQRGDCNEALGLAESLSKLEAAAETGEAAAAEDRIRARILAACGQNTEAVELQERIVAADPDDGAARIQYSVYLERLGRVEEAIGQLEEALRLYPENPLIKNNLAYTLIEAGLDPNRAGDLLEQSLRDDPESAPALDSLGWFHYKQGQFERALEYIYQAGAGISGYDAEILNHLGDTLYRLGRGDDAAWYWRKGLEALEEQVKKERYLTKDRERLAEKLRALADGREPKAAPLFGQ